MGVRLPRHYVVPDFVHNPPRLLLPGWLRMVILFLLSAGGPLVVYGRTAAPGVLSGDGAEFQFAAYLPGVPHPTGYPLYTMLSWLATFLVPIGEPAYRVTLVSAGAGAITVALLALLLLRITGRFFAALIGAITLAVAPGFWGAANQAEVYTLNTLLLIVLALLLWEIHHLSLPSPVVKRGALALATLVSGLGFTHHGSFALIGLPLLVCFGIIPWLWPTLPMILKIRRDNNLSHSHPPALRTFFVDLASMAIGGIVGLTPWLWVFIQYMRMGPFDGLDHGLRPGQVGSAATYFWGAPVNLGEVFDHLFGGVMRKDVFRIPGANDLIRITILVGDRLWFELGPVGILLGCIGCVALFRRQVWAWGASMLIAGMTLCYVISLGRAVQDTVVFLLPLLLPWSLWAGVGSDAVARRAEWLWMRIRTYIPLSFSIRLPSPIITTGVSLLLVMVMLQWGHSRFPYTNKAHLQVFREFAEGSLERVEPDAVIISRWEQGTTLLYLWLVEQQRPDVWIDVIEPEDEDWRERIQRRYAERVVYGVGNAQDVALLEAEPIWQTAYAILFRIHHLPGPGENLLAK